MNNTMKHTNVKKTIIVSQKMENDELAKCAFKEMGVIRKLKLVLKFSFTNFK